MSKKGIIRIVGKAVLFSFLLVLMVLGLQYVLEYKWERYEHLESRYACFREEAPNSVDVILLGSSPTYAGISPNVLWGEKGITGYNFGVSNQISVFDYYILEYCLQFQMPKLVVLEFNHVCAEQNVDEDPDNTERLYRKMVNTMPDFAIKREMIQVIHDRYPKQNIWSYWIPLLRYHSRWEELHDYDFDRSLNRVSEEYDDCLKGCLCRAKIEKQTWPKQYPYGKTEDILDYYESYYQKIVDLCEENDIQVLLTVVPSLNTRKCDYEQAVVFAEKNHLQLMAVVEKEQWEEIGIDISKDMYNKGHLNILGQRKYSKVVADFLSENYDLPDHRGDPYYSSWEDCYLQYQKRYDEKAKELLK